MHVLRQRIQLGATESIYLMVDSITPTTRYSTHTLYTKNLSTLLRRHDKLPKTLNLYPQILCYQFKTFHIYIDLLYLVHSGYNVPCLFSCSLVSVQQFSTVLVLSFLCYWLC